MSSQNTVSIEVGYTADEESFYRVVGLMMMGEWTGEERFIGKGKRVPSKKEIVDYIKQFRDEATWMVIRLNGKIVGCSIPRPVIGNRAIQARVNDSDGYWRIGTLYLLPDYRGKGYASSAGKLFMLDHPKIVYYFNANNVASAGLARALGLKMSHRLYLKDQRTYFRVDHRWPEGTYITYNVFMNE